MNASLFCLLISLLGAPADLPSAHNIQAGLPAQIQTLTANLGESGARVAVLVYPDVKTAGKLEIETWTNEIETLVSQVLRNQGYRPVVDEELSAGVRDRARAGSVRPTDVKSMSANADAALVVLFAEKQNKLGLRFTLVSDAKIVSRGKLGETPVVLATGAAGAKTKTANKQTGLYGNGLAMAGGNARFNSSQTGGYGAGSLSAGSLAMGLSVGGLGNQLGTARGLGLGTRSEVRTGTNAGAEEKDCPDPETGAEGDATGSPDSSNPGTGKGDDQEAKSGTDSVKDDTKPATGGGGDEAPKNVPALNQKVLQFSIDMLGQQVGNGECWTLGAEALRTAGAQPPNLYDFGDDVENISGIVPGDILQFHSAKFETANSTVWMGAPNHTAVVYRITGSQVTVLHQNFNNNRTVSTLTFDLASRTSGTVIAYRPVARE